MDISAKDVVSYSVGYYYGRSMIQDVAEQDLVLKETASFKQGFLAGKLDFAEVDLTNLALSLPPND